MPYFEDIEIGDFRTTGSCAFSRDEALDFARQFDPASTWLDEEDVRISPWLIAARWMRCMIDGRDGQKDKSDSVGGGVSPGFLKMEYMFPVRAGETLTFTSQITAKLPMGKRTDVGIVRSLNRAMNEDGREVWRFQGQGLYPRKEPLETS